MKIGKKKIMPLALLAVVICFLLGAAAVSLNDSLGRNEKRLSDQQREITDLTNQVKQLRLSPVPSLKPIESTLSPLPAPSASTKSSNRGTEIYLKIPPSRMIQDSDKVRYSYALEAVIKLGATEINGKLINQEVASGYYYFKQPFEISVENATQYLQAVSTLESLGATNVYF